MLQAMMLACSVIGAPPAATPVAVVFDVQDDGAKLEAKVTARLGEYIATLLAESGRFQVVPSSEVHKALSTEKANSYKACYDEGCQIEIGKELAAEKTLSTKISRIGRRCIVTMNLYDLGRATTERAASEKTTCGEDAIVDAIEKVVQGLTAAEAPKRAGRERAEGPQRDDLSRGALTIPRLAASLAGFRLDGTARTSMGEAKAILRHLGVERLLHEQGSLLVGVLRADTAISVWLDAYGVANCYSVRFGPNEPHLPYHAHNRTYFEVCKTRGSPDIEFDAGKLRADPGLRNLGTP